MGNNTSSDENVQDYDDLDEDLTLLIPTLELLVARLIKTKVFFKIFLLIYSTNTS